MASTGKMVQQGVGMVVAFTVSAILVAFLLTVGINQIVDVDTSNWSSGAQSIWGIMDLILILGIFLLWIGWAVTSFDIV